MKTNIHQVLFPHIGKKEALLWSSKPNVLALPTALNIGGIIFHSLIFGLFFFANHELIFRHINVDWIDISMLSVCIALAHLLIRLFYHFLVQSSTFYGITDKRVIIKSGIFSSIVQSFDIRRIQYMEILEMNKRYGVLNLFLKNHANHKKGKFFKAWNTKPDIHQIKGVSDIVDVYHLLSEIIHIEPPKLEDR